MDLPTAIRVGPYDFRITRVPKEALQTGCFADCNTPTQVIRIDEIVTGVLLVDCVLHELTHALWWTSGLDHEALEERAICSLSTGWVQVWRDNPRLLEWIGFVLTSLRG